MNGRIALLLKDRISQFTYVGKLAGLVSIAKKQREGKEVRIPVGLNVDDVHACTESTMLDMIPDAKYAAMVYFEDRGYQRRQDRTKGISFTSRVRLVCWVNTKRLGGDNLAGDKIAQEFIGAIESGIYNSEPIIGIIHRVEGVPQKGFEIFSAYTYDDAERQFLLPPYDAFAIDIITKFRIRPGCEDQVAETDPGCWNPPTTKRRRNPNEFTEEELCDPVHGLTDAQKAAPCVCGTGGSLCDQLGDVAEEDVIDDVFACLSPAAQAALIEALQMDYIEATYDTEAEALLDEVTTPAEKQAILVAGRLYQGDGTSNAKQLVEAKVFNPSVSETSKGLNTFANGALSGIQLIEPTA